ncbi:tetratricopeptide repeat protein [Uliginosibacterium gangwonense]|uniref:tetratricopeptide repeat protein n=1 Tax=Uliginosibacterium gangwonense TaxID=392736 RepID=UPI00036BF9DD|nr:tetratricopeptide repeat protein [Uliginosibacterium gangwonense]
MRPSRLLKHALLLAGIGLIASHSPAFAQSTRSEGDKGKPATKAPTISSAEYLLQSFLSEVAARRGDPGVAVGTYLGLARKTNDPRMARRATEIALQAQDLPMAAEAARVWLSIEPDSQLALQMTTAITAETSKKLEDLEASLKVQMEKQPGRRAAILMQLPQLMARYQDTQANRQAIFRLSEPYLKLPESHYVRAVGAAMAQDTQTATTEVATALALRPDWEEAAMLRWRITPATERKAGIETLHQFGEANPQAADARLTYVRWLTGEKRDSDAQAAATKLLADIPDNDELRYAVAGVRVETGDWAGAEALVRELLQRDFRDADLLRLQLAQIVEEQNRPQEALQLYGDVPQGSQYPAAIERQARLYFKLGQAGEAHNALQQAILEQAENANVFQLVDADLLRQEGKNAESFKELDQILAREPDNLEALYMSALIADPLKHYDVMEQRLQRLITLKPDYAQAYNALGYSYVERNTKLDEAATLLEKAVKLAPEDGAILDSMAWLRFRQGDYASAKDFALRSMALLNDPEVQAHYVEILWVSGQKDEARKAFNDARKAFPNNATLESLKKKLGIKP